MLPKELKIKEYAHKRETDFALCANQQDTEKNSV